MKELKPLIDKLIEFGVSSAGYKGNQIDKLKNLLVQIYLQYLNVESKFDENEYDDCPRSNYDLIRKNVEANFPDFGWYSVVLEPEKMIPNAEIAVGDAIDDLTDIIIDLSEVKWRMENTSESDAIYHFEFLMNAHSEQHLVDLLKYLKATN